MIKKCDAFCDARPKNLWLRGGVFYYSVELLRKGGKRRYERKSLHTSDFLEAKEQLSE